MTTKSKLWRTLPNKLAFALGFIFSAFFALNFLHDLFEGELLKVNAIHVVETPHVKSEEVNLYLSKYISQPLFNVNLQDVSSSLLSHPWVKDAKVRRVLPNTLQIEPVEREGIAITKGDDILLDKDGAGILKHYKDPSLPRIDAAKNNLLQAQIGARLVHFYNRSSRKEGNISKVFFDYNDAAHVVFKSGLQVVIGKKDFQAKWQRFEEIIDTINGKLDSFEYIYLGKYPNSHQVAVKLK